MGYSLFLLEIYLLFSFVYWFNDSSGRRYVLLNFNLIIFFLGELIVRGIFWPSLLYGFYVLWREWRLAGGTTSAKVTLKSL